MTGAPGVIATNLKLVAGNGILGIVDLTIPAWHLTFLRCRWRRDAQSERVTLGACDDVVFLDGGVTQRFQAAALKAVRELARAEIDP